jgi:dTDP-4-dehydrorhamnose reductase
MIAVAGPHGRLGSCLVEHYDCVPLICDITKPDSIQKAIDKLEPQVVINCAAFTGVDEAETEKYRDLAKEINLRGPANIRQSFMGYFVHISTGFVFGGKGGPFKETATREPANWYGWTKFGGEEAALIREPTLVIRTLDLYGTGPKSDFVRAVREHLELGVEKALPDYLYKTPTYIPHLAEGIMSAIKKGLNGFLHIAGSRTLNTMEWGQMIADKFGYDSGLIVPGKITGDAPRPLRGGLNTDLAKSLDIPIYSPDEGLEALSQMGVENAP